MIPILNHLYQKRYRGFTLYETILSTFILILILNFSYIKYQNFKENQSILEAKTKINEAFFYTSLNSLKFHKNYILKLDTNLSKITILDENYETIKQLYLPKNLHYFHTQKSITPIINFTKSGNIARSFSIYIFNKKNEVKYRISLYGFDKNRVLKINNYKKRNNSTIKKSQIMDYHQKTNESRESFNTDWEKE